ncbi:MAG: CoA activase [Epsilonproteobacteria bacterium]|nr:CoA activase [Campylobacterota bacterium]OIO14629.1 MAG: CoA activase [Helicobacteraceae bacterium CG1_02_36_14]PIP09585.1 MAG: CoA activase [Sulfurimonas sp. CG23_combo_of_CG06-09_8_20_14_all_36_33]PIS25314.1 MAG: CoA activase [Sulfurimonas sp. CG08_land_8_20_14_0_20_36_33]PIU33572.1 MAG: CoA activase [Sulfurimonas sp. CG07_land_8_20_14_0_80_36_56]PIV04041.1 MAG: CoA activase [Sulfurimonas sp. CG03_land_8_20_14_0_80_36_25]PIV35567.1 MAG: CoA activase [Sulfurimonas sp. CG02_land_8_20_14_3_
MKYFAGIDIGSTAIKITIIDENKEMVGHRISGSGSMFYNYAHQTLNDLLKDLNISKEEVLYTVATGYGRKLFKEADENISEITANAIGAVAAAKEFGAIKTIINIGGQDSKAISLDEMGNVVNFAMNDRCAAGTGKFLDACAMNLEIGVEELGERHFNSKGTPLSINSTCAVFAESEIIGLLGNSHSVEDIVSGVHYSIAKRIVKLVKRVGIKEGIYFDGGPALNGGLVNAIENELGKKIFIPTYPQVTTSFGAAILGVDSYNYQSVGV